MTTKACEVQRALKLPSGKKLILVRSGPHLLTDEEIEAVRGAGYDVLEIDSGDTKKSYEEGGR